MRPCRWILTAMDPDEASRKLADLVKTINDSFTVEVVESHMGSSARGSNAKQVPELPPEAKKEVPKAKK